MTYEYRTTSGDIATFYRDPENGPTMTADGDDPLQPEGEGWEMVGMAATPARLYWSWRRKVSASEKTKVQP